MAVHNYNNKSYTIISYNVMSNSQLAGLLSIIDIEAPQVILLQEILMNTEHLCTFLSSKHGYKGVSNVDELEPNKPGTAIVWHDSVPVTQVASLEPRRLQSCYVGPYLLLNCYPPAGTENVTARRDFFRNQLFRAMRGLGTKVPILGGDWNCIVNVRDTEGGDYYKKKSQDLLDLTRDFNVTDAFRHLHHDAREFTWSRKGLSSSRLDRFYIPQDLLNGLGVLSHHPFLSDHKYVKMKLELPEIERKVKANKQHDSGFWKLNVSILEEEDFMLEFGVLWARIKQRKEEYNDISDWWDSLAKPECVGLCMRYSAMMARCRRGLKDMLMIMLESALSEKMWVDVAVIRGRLREIMNKESLGFQVRSRFKENIEKEKASLFHLNREKKKSGQRVLSKMIIGGQEVEDRAVVEDEVTGFFGALFQGHHRRGGENVGQTFEPDFTNINEFLADLGTLSEESKAKIQAEATMEELEMAVEQLQEHKSPGLDGLPAEFYKKTGVVINSELLEVINCQLETLALVESNKNGATRLGPKVEGVPRVDQLRPITLLNLDYKILTKIITNRLLKVIGEVIFSGQSCSVPEKNILFGAHNILSVIQYVEKFGGKGAAVNYDLYKAYDRVCLLFLYRVLERMNFGDRFISWIKMFHHGATTRFLLDFITKPIDILISVRQGDPLAMLLFIIYMEPLLMLIRKSVRGFFFWGEREHNTRLQGSDTSRDWERCVNTKDEDFVDDVTVCIEDENDLLIVDNIFRKFEDLSGAILNRDA